MITIWGKHAPHIKTFTHTGAGWELIFPCGHERFVTNQEAIDYYTKHALPICDKPNCTGSAPPKPATLARCPTTLSVPGMAIRHCDLPWGHHGDHHDPRFGPWASLLATSPETSAPITTLQRWTAFGQPRCPSVSPVTDRHQCRLAIGHACGHVSDCGKFEWADKDTARDDRRRQAEVDLTSLANGDRLGPDATNNARIVQDMIRPKSPAAHLPTFDQFVERQKFEASVTKTLLEHQETLKGLKDLEAIARQRIDALVQHVTNLEHQHKTSTLERVKGLETEVGRHAKDLDDARKTCINILQAVGKLTSEKQVG